MIVAVVDVCFIWVLNSIFNSFPGCLWREISCDILWASRFVEDAGLSTHVEVLAEGVKPFEDGCIAWKRPKPNFIKRLLKAKYAQCLLLSQKWFSISLRNLWIASHVAEKEIPTRSERCDSARFLILRPTNTIPPVDVEVFALDHHVLSCEERFAFL